MDKVLVIRQRLKEFYSRFDLYILPILKFVTMLAVLLTMNSMIGYREFLTKWMIVVLVPLVCCLLPWGALPFASAVFLLGHLSALSWEAAVLACIFLFLAGMVHYLFLPGYSLVIALIPLFFVLKIPYVIPLVLGLVGGATSFIPAGFGVFAYYFLVCIQKNAGFLMDSTVSVDSLQRFTQVMAALKDNSLMFLTAAAFSATVLLVYGIRKLSADYAPYIALAVGGVANVLIFLAGGFLLNVGIPYVNVFLGNLVSILIAFLALFWVVAVDYSRTEYIQYEDDEYVYFVKAVPKITVTPPDVKVQEINPRIEEDSNQEIQEALEMLDSMENEEE
ncbi:ABC transporter permease [Hominifimenecus sp. rT4P-3]|uniref:ABC transporter permease n=1 Tax=Hominifimenecus sp. rT4P-3 TaxID=3242979 RepID=UPI003DA597BA